MKKNQMKISVLLPIAVCMIFLAALWGIHSRERGFFDATKVDLRLLELKLAEHGYDGAEGFTAFSISDQALQDILSSVSVRPEKKQLDLPHDFFMFHFWDSDGMFTEIIVGCDGEIIVGPPTARQFWQEAKKSAYQNLLDYFDKASSSYISSDWSLS